MEQAAAEFGINPRTISARLTQEGIRPGKDERYSTKEIARAIYSDLEVERTRLVRAEAVAQERENKEKECRLINIDEFAKDYEQVYLGIVRVVKSAKLTEAEQNEILQQLHELHVEA